MQHIIHQQPPWTKLETGMQCFHWANDVAIQWLMNVHFNTKAITQHLYSTFLAPVYEEEACMGYTFSVMTAPPHLNQQCQSIEGNSDPKDQASIPPGTPYRVTIIQHNKCN